MLVFKKIIDVMRSIEAVGKDRRNNMQGYNFRGIDDVYNMLHEHLAAVGVFAVPYILEERSEERASAKGGLLIYRILKIKYVFYAEDGSFLESVVIGEAMDSGDKASNKAMSVAHKYALLQIFAIPTSDPKDVENENPEPTKKQNNPTSSTNQPAQKQTVLFDKNNEKCSEWMRKILADRKLDEHFNEILEKAHGKELKPGWLEAFLA